MNDKLGKLLKIHKYIKALQLDEGLDVNISINKFKITNKSEVKKLLRKGFSVTALAEYDTYHSGHLYLDGLCVGYIYTDDDPKRFNKKTENFFKQFEEKIN